MAELTGHREAVREPDGAAEAAGKSSADACCDASALPTCCEPAAKSDCCGTTPVEQQTAAEAPSSCGCST